MRSLGSRHEPSRGPGAETASEGEGAPLRRPRSRLQEDAAAGRGPTAPAVLLPSDTRGKWVPWAAGVQGKGVCGEVRVRGSLPRMCPRGQGSGEGASHSALQEPGAS